MQRITIRASADAAHWARRKAEQEGTPVSELLRRIFERQREADSYRAAYERFKTYPPSAQTGASGRMSREAAYEHRPLSRS